MKTKIVAMLTPILFTFGASVALAATGREDNSSLVVWGFLGFCALIVVAQLVPLIGNLRQLAHARKESQLQPSAVKTAGNKQG
ncbi:MAG: hypothetical protein WCY68_14470 [Desulfuromonadales bacterium]